MKNGKYPKGSEWRIWDLHIHSPLSYLSNRFDRLPNGQPDWERYITALENLPEDIKVVAITDYFSIDGYKEVRKWKDEYGRLKNIDLILPNLELRLNIVVDSRKSEKASRRLNYHIIFSNNLHVDSINDNFIHNLDIYEPGCKDDNSMKLKESSLIQLGKNISNKRKDNRTDYLQVGAENAYVGFNKILDNLKSSIFKDNYILVLAHDNWDDISWNGQDYSLRNNLLSKSDMVFCSNTKYREWCLGLGNYENGEDAYIDEFASLKPCIWGSDAHEFNKIGKPELNRFCWIKADPTFDGLKQILFEPEDRVRIQEDNPSPTKSMYSISNVSISNFSNSNGIEEIKIDNTSIPINAGLVIVTGGRGAGKTAFVDLIANCYSNKNIENSNSFIKRLVENSYNAETTLSFLRDTDLFTKLKLDDRNYYTKSNAEYIPQGIFERELNEIDRLVNELIHNNPVIRNTSYLELETIQSNIEQLKLNISRHNKEIIQLMVETASERKIQISAMQQKIEADIINLRYIYNDKDKNELLERDRINDISKKFLFDREKYKDYSDLLLCYDNILEFYERFGKQLNKSIDDIKTINIKYNINFKLPELFIDENYIDLVDTYIKDIKEELNTLREDITYNQNEINNLSDTEKKYALIKDDLSHKETLLLDVKSQYKNIEDKESNINQLIFHRNKLYIDYITEKLHYCKLFDKKYSVYKSQNSAFLNDIDICKTITYNKIKLLDILTTIYDGRKILINNNMDLIKLFEKIIIEDNKTECVEALNNQILEDINKLKGDKDDRYNKLLELYKILFTDNIELTTEIKYKNKSFSKLSMGQKASVIIKLYLALNNETIIIDSQDDYLDNMYIMEELIQTIKDAKNDRQIILATNNGNIAINSDAEQLIIASYNDNKISYFSGSIEDPDIRQEALKVLEGGKEAFEKRRDKYRLS